MIQTTLTLEELNDFFKFKEEFQNVLSNKKFIVRTVNTHYGDYSTCYYTESEIIKEYQERNEQLSNIIKTNDKITKCNDLNIKYLKEH
jgi:hypothetical protein